MKLVRWLVLGMAVMIVVPMLLMAQSAEELYADSRKLEEATDRKLVAAYQKLVKEIGKEHEPERAKAIIDDLEAAQKAWEKYRDAQIQFVGMNADIGSASARAAGLATYRAELTAARVKELQEVPNPF